MRDSDYRSLAKDWIGHIDVDYVEDNARSFNSDISKIIDKLILGKADDNAYRNMIKITTKLFDAVSENIGHEDYLLSTDITSLIMSISIHSRISNDCIKPDSVGFSAGFIFESLVRHITDYILNFCDIYREVLEDSKKLPAFFEQKESTDD